MQLVGLFLVLTVIRILRIIGRTLLGGKRRYRRSSFGWIIIILVVIGAIYGK